MPFTLSHVALVFPIKWGLRNRASMTGLIVGSMVPDFEKFIKMGPGNTYSHSWAGIFWFNLPLGLLLTFVFHLLLRDPLIENLPEYLRRRLFIYKEVRWVSHFKKFFPVICISIIIGAFSHIVLDGLTRDHGRLVKYFPIDKNAMIIGSSIHIPFSFMVEVLGALIGLMVIFFFILRLPPAEIPSRSFYKKISYFFHCLLFAVLIIFLRVSGGAIKNSWEFIYTSISAFLIGLTFSSLSTLLFSNSIGFRTKK